MMTLIGVRQSYEGRDEVNEDLELYNRIRGGDEDALEELIGIYRRPLTNFINGFINDENEAEDLMIDVFVDLVRSKGGFRGDSTLKTYLFAVGRNKAMRYIRRKRKFSVVDISAADYFLVSSSPEEDFLKKLKNEEIKKSFEKLNPDYREILYLLYFEGMSYEQAGQVMHKNLKQITNLAYRAKQSLKKILIEGGVCS